MRWLTRLFTRRSRSESPPALWLYVICSRCGEVVEFQFEAFEILQRELAAKHGYRLTAHFHELIGICSACQATQAALRN